MSRSQRTFHLTLLGATGFAGKLTAQYLARNAPPGFRWALAGRNQSALEDVRRELAALEPALADLPLLPADVTDRSSVDAIAADTQVLATTVGPYVLYGDAVVAACAAAGTDYLDLTGEPEFVDRSYVLHHRTALESGARLIHAAGFDSIPHDLGAYFTALQLPADSPMTIAGYVRASGMFSGGTFYSALTAFSRPRQNLTAARERRSLEVQDPSGRRVRSGPGRPGRDPVGGWALPFPSLDPQIVGRSARAVPRYGPDFAYTHHISVERLPVALGIPVGAAALLGAAQVPPLRRALVKRAAPGQGPSPAKRAQSWFTVTFVGEAGGERITTRVSGGDPGYDETAKMLAESAMCLALDADLPETAGQTTTAAAMGEALIDRLRKADMTFELLG